MVHMHVICINFWSQLNIRNIIFSKNDPFNKNKSGKSQKVFDSIFEKPKQAVVSVSS